MPLKQTFQRLRLQYRMIARKPVSPDMAAIQTGCRQYPRKRILAQTVEQTRFVIIDTETTGFGVYAGDEIISVALLEYQGLQATGKVYTQLIHPGRPIPETSSRIHGIHDKDVAGQPDLATVLPAIMDFIGDAVLVGHHINFDTRFLNRYLQQHAACKLNNLWLDTMLLFTSHTGHMGQYSLEDVARYCKVEITDRHSALGDARAAAAIFETLLPQLAETSATIKQLYNQQFSHDSDL